MRGELRVGYFGDQEEYRKPGKKKRYIIPFVNSHLSSLSPSPTQPKPIYKSSPSRSLHLLSTRRLKEPNKIPKTKIQPFTILLAIMGAPIEVSSPPSLPLLPQILFLSPKCSFHHNTTDIPPHLQSRQVNPGRPTGPGTFVQCVNGAEATGDSSGDTLGDIVGNLLDCGGLGNRLPGPL